jgi:uncharacterized protein YndB with AHSA1/START domain
MRLKSSWPKKKNRKEKNDPSLKTILMAKKLGELKKDPVGYTIRFEREFNYPVSAVWDAITNPDKLAVWFTDVKMELEPGAKMEIRFRDENNTLTYGRVSRVIPGKLFEYFWENDDGPDELALWELEEIAPKKCKLILTYSRLGNEYAVKASAGWHTMLDHLAATLDGRMNPFPFDGGDSEAEKALVDEYAQIWAQRFSPLQLSDQYGTFLQKGDKYDIVFDRVLAHPVSKVWKAITDPAELNKWLCSNRKTSSTSIDLRVGGKVCIQLMMAVIEGTITNLKEEALLQYQLEEDNALRWELFEEGEDHCRLRFTEVNASGEYLPGMTTGWHGYFDFLAMVLDNKEVPGFPIDAWEPMTRSTLEKYTSIANNIKHQS